MDDHKFVIGPRQRRIEATIGPSVSSENCRFDDYYGIEFQSTGVLRSENMNS